MRSISARLAKAVVGLVAVRAHSRGHRARGPGDRRGPRTIRDLIVRQANQYLTATLSHRPPGRIAVARIQLGGRRVARDGQTLIRIDESRSATAFASWCKPASSCVSVRLTRPQVVGGQACRTGAGISAHWSGATSREQERTGPNRPIEMQSIEIIDGRISLQRSARFRRRARADRFPAVERAVLIRLFPRSLDAEVRSRLVDRPRTRSVGQPARAAVFGRGPGGWFFEHFSVHTARSAFTLDGRDQHRREADRARAAGARAALRLSGVVGRPARSEEHRGRGDRSTRR